MPIVPKEISIGNKACVGGFNRLFLISGPCVLESEDHAFKLAAFIKNICDDLRIPFIFKASFDKANRSSIASYRGPGISEGLRILGQIKKELTIPVISDIHEPQQAAAAAEVLDIIQIPAFLCRQTDLLLAAADTRKPINIKKGQFLSPYEVKNLVEKVLSRGNEEIIITERGTSFGYNDLVFDVRSIPLIKDLGFPVVIDASHSVQKPGGQGSFSGGDARFIPYIARAGVSAGADGIFMEIHDQPAKARSDSRNSLKTNELRKLLETLLKIHKIIFREKC